MLGIRGRPADLAFWWVSVGWCAWPAGVPNGVALLADLALGDAGVPNGLLPATRLDKVGCGATGAFGALGVTGVLGDSAPWVVVARGISGSW
ncbi:hypothetical protein [Mycobacteroides abscessus]|uniref:hypothetical protein n=1 Tax=Mycobacteroides abscessus TaxID=36809 RepID=UPI001F1A156D|nr:hypothetical protein [Mycobacteroides abscessus]